MTGSAVLSFKEFAKHLGVRPSYVTALRKAGRLVLTDDGKRVLVAESEARIAATRDPSRADVSARHAAARGSALPLPSADPKPPAPDAGDEEPDESDPDYQTWRARKERAAAQREEIRLAEDQGRLLQREEVVASLRQAMATLRNRLESLGATLAPVITGEPDETRVSNLITDEVDRALHDLEIEFRAMAHAAKGPQSV